MLKVAALLAWLPGLGVGLPCVYGHLVLRGPGCGLDVHGVPTYGGGAFEDAGIDTSVPLLVALLCV
jgi:hypothetical protein